MKMPRTQCEAGNVQFVQELAEIDGPFEAPININFRDLTKLELPALVWNRSDACPRKMKITNTGHTVIVSAKWKCERPYLSGGPLLGKYVFSQIHFHWGQTDCRGSEHQICGEEFPLEMHVAHFKTEYMTQESALREKDGMVVVVYLFKLQEEPNHSLKRIINSLPRVRQPSTSHAIDPRPIVSLCNPFTEDYFMYWGSVVTSTCAHILLWLICREPFGISKEQVCEFRKIMDPCQQPICKNSREVQPLHKRNVFHVNASKHLDEPLLPIKKRLGCYCKESKDAFSTSNSCHCQGAYQNQEDVEGNSPQYANIYSTCKQGAQTEHSCFGNQTFIVQRATIGSVIMLKRPGSDPIRNQTSPKKLKKVKSEICNRQAKLVTKSCCFLPSLEPKKINNLNEKRKAREKTKLFDSAKAFSQIMNSLEALKNQTFKKLKKIESINQEIKDMKPFCQDTEDKKWIRKIEKTLLKQRRFTIKSSRGCLSELKKLAKDCNFDKYFDSKALPVNGRKMMWLANNMITNSEDPCYDNPIEQEETHVIENQSSKHSDIGKTNKFTSQAQKLIESFFEDIKESDDLQETVTNDPNFKKIKSLCSVGGDSKSVLARNKGYITQKMFNLGNLGDRFFTEITTEDVNSDENSKTEEQNEEVTTAEDVNMTKTVLDRRESEKLTEASTESKSKTDEVIPLHRVNIPVLFPKDTEEEMEASKTLVCQEESCEEEKYQKFPRKKANKRIQNFVDDNEELFFEIPNEKLMKTLERKVIPTKSQSSSLNLSTDSISTRSKVTKKVRKSKKGFSDQSKRKASVIFKIPSKKTSYKKIEGINTQKKKLKNKKKKQTHEIVKYENSGTLTSSSKEEADKVLNKPLQEKKTETQVKLEVEKRTESALISPERKKMTAASKENMVIKMSKNLITTETRTVVTDLPPKPKIECVKVPEENPKEIESSQKLMKESLSEEQQSIPLKSIGNESQTKTLTNKTYRASSVDSKRSNSKTRVCEDNSSNARLKNTNLKKEISKLLEEKPFSKINCRSLTDISIKPKAEFVQRLQLESVDGRKKTNQEVLVKKLKENYKKAKEPLREASSETYKKANEEQQKKDIETLEKCSKSQNTLEHDMEFLTESQVSDDFTSKVQVRNEKGSSITQKGKTAKKKQLIQKESEETFEVLHSWESDKSFARHATKGDTEFLTPDNKNFQTSVSCSTLKKNATSRTHSAETLHSLKTNQKRKGKKRPHCSKINSRHYIRKNHSVFKKPSKPFHFLSLTDEEQLKILSVNVAKYIKQKLLDEKNLSEVEKTPSVKIEKEVKVPEKKSGEPPKQESPTVHLQKTKKFRIPVLKSRGRTREKEKDAESVKKPNTAESQIETVKKKPELLSPPRPVNNFIELNKQMAGTYKRLPPTALKKMEPTNLGIQSTEKIPKPKIKTQKKTKEKFPTQIPSPKGITSKGRQARSSIATKRPDSNTKTVNKVQASSPKVEKPNEGEGIKGKSDSEKVIPPPATPRPKKCSVKNQESNSAVPETSENVNGENHQQKLFKKGKMEGGIPSETLFKKELEYFITMQMYLNNEFSKNPEHPLRYLNSKLLKKEQNQEVDPLGNDSFQNLDLSGNDVVVVKKKNLDDCLSSCSEITERTVSFSPEKVEDNEKNEEKSQSKKGQPAKAPKEFHESIELKPEAVQQGSEDVPSDSSYDCKISITLNTNLNAKETDNENEGQSYETYSLKENCNSQMTTSLEGSSSHLTDIKPDNKKKESEISLEMKQKLLEILEGEIKREMGIPCGVSSGNLSDGLGFKAGDSEANLESQTQSTGSSSSDNIETLNQISSSMRQYLTYLRRLPDESKDYDEFLLEKGDEAF